MSGFLSLFVPSSTPAPAATAAPASHGPDADRLTLAFQSAADRTGLPFDFFMTTAMRESSLDVHAAATTSTARGPFQFIEQTWLAMVHDHGSSLGLAREASAIERGRDGRYRIGDEALREQILSLRHDPALSAVMSGLYVRENAAELSAALGREVSVGEGYVAHVFGPSGATRLIQLAEQQPARTAADVFPTQAAANRGLFYTRAGEPVSVRDLYDRLVSGFSDAPVPRDLAFAAEGRTPTVRPSEPLALEPEGFDALPEAVPPDALARRGLFSARSEESLGRMRLSGASVPFFAGLYHPDGLGSPELLEEVSSTHGTGQPGPDAVRQAHGQTGLPLDLLAFAASGQLDAAYRNRAEDATARELSPGL